MIVSVAEGRKWVSERHAFDHRPVLQLAVVALCDVCMRVALGTVVEPT